MLAAAVAVTASVVGIVAAVYALLEDTAILGEPVDDDADDDRENVSEDTGGTPSSPFEVRTLDAPGSEAGVVPIPPEEGVIVVNFGRTRCPTSRRQLSVIAAADLGDAAIVTVTDPRRDPTDDDEGFVEWWQETEGAWTLGVDDDGTVNDHYGIDGFPRTLIVDEDGEVRWRGRGETDREELEEAVERVDRA